MKRFSIVDKGYDIDEVNRFIDIVIRRMEKLNTENTTYIAKIENLNKKISEINNNSTEVNRLEKAILAVQETNDRIKEVSKEEARIIIEEAKNNANSIIHEALIKAEKIEYERLVLEKNMKVYKERLKSILEAQLEIANDLDKIEI
ncbi:MAG: DivIVA domain-containing protein [Bacilli bacterium]|nr:DivIVA domain-containing protein [Bacilli bacterium]